jgi:glutamyl-tRNA reductase
VIATMSHRLINKILHEPTMCLKQEAAHGNGAAYISTLRQLFALEQATAKPGQSREEIA